MFWTRKNASGASAAHGFSSHVRLVFVCVLPRPRNHSHVFELDIAPTQQLKKRLLQQANVTVPDQLTFVSIDFAKASLVGTLGKAGFDKLRKTLFVWEGVMCYLPAEAVDHTLSFITANSPAGSTLCFDYLAEAADMMQRYGVKESRSAMETTYRAEPVQFRIQEGTIGAFLSERGYSLVEHLTASDLEREYLTLRDGSSAGKVLACFCLVQARVVNQAQQTQTSAARAQ